MTFPTSPKRPRPSPSPPVVWDRDASELHGTPHPQDGTSHRISATKHVCLPFRLGNGKDQRHASDGEWAMARDKEVGNEKKGVGLLTCSACLPPSYRTARTLTFSCRVVSRRWEKSGLNLGELNALPLLARPVVRAWRETEARRREGAREEKRDAERVRSTIVTDLC
jgi:hypothetical protein